MTGVSDLDREGGAFCILPKQCVHLTHHRNGRLSRRLVQIPHSVGPRGRSEESRGEGLCRPEVILDVHECGQITLSCANEEEMDVKYGMMRK